MPGVPRKPRQRPAGKGGATLADIDKARIRATPQAMLGWLLHGLPAVGLPVDRWNNLPTSPLNWCGGGQVDQVVAGAGPQALAGFAWAQVTLAKAKLSQPLALPNVGQLVGSIKNLLKTRTTDEVVALIRCVAQNWQVIQQSLGNWGASLSLDERCFSIPQVISQADRLVRGERIVALNSFLPRSTGTVNYDNPQPIFGRTTCTIN